MADRAFTVDVPLGVRPEDAAALSDLLVELSAVERSIFTAPPLMAPAMLLGTDGLGEVMRLMHPPEGMGVLHESQMFHRIRPIVKAQALTIGGVIQAQGDILTLEFTLQDGVDILGQMQTRLRFVVPEIMRALKGAEFRAAMNTPETSWTKTKPVAQECVDTYLALSHDPNPIHRDEKAAQAVGLAQPVVPGMLVAGLCETALKGTGFDPDQMRTRYLSPLMVGETLHLGVQVKRGEGAVWRARIFAITDKAQIVAISDATRDSRINPVSIP